MELLLIDDDCELLESLGGLLEAYDINVTRAQNGLAARERVAAQHFDVIVSDRHIGSEDGVQLLRSIRDESTDLKSQLVIMSGMLPSTTQADTAGFLLIQKPFSIGDFFKLVGWRATTQAA